MSGPVIFLLVNLIIAAVLAWTAGAVGIGIAVLLVAEGMGYYLYDQTRRKKKEESKQHDQSR